MVSVLRTLQAEWNNLVPQATALGIRRVRTLNLPLETIEYRRTKLNWLRGEIDRLALTTRAAPDVSQDLSVLTFGVELEFLMPSGMDRTELAAKINSAGVQCRAEGYGHSVTPHWKLVTDGSLGDYSRGTEAVSPVLRGDEGFNQLLVVCGVLKRVGCKVTKKCGLHVHVGASQWSVASFKNLVRLYKSAERSIDSFMAPSRRDSNNMFCRALRILPSIQVARTVDEVARAMGQSPGRENARGGGRYYKLNLQSFWQHGTVEFRHHQGTVEGDKALHWTKLCLRMALAAMDGADNATSFDALFEATKSPAAEKEFFQGRATFFASQLARANGTTVAPALSGLARDHARERQEQLDRDRALASARQEAVVERVTPVQTMDGRTVRVDRSGNPFSETADDLSRRAFTRGQE